MDKVNSILHNSKYVELIRELNNYEETREFCKHNLEHFMDLSRIAYIKVLERGLKYDKEVIYAIGLLHDIGRVLEYENGTPHHIGSKLLANEILQETKFSLEEKTLILECIENHRKDSTEELAKIIYEADKESRSCFNCEAILDCYWDKNKKNMNIKY